MFSHMAIINGVTGCGKTHYVMDLLQSGPYKVFFDVVTVLCPTFLNNDTYMSRYDKTFSAKKKKKKVTKYIFITGTFQAVLKMCVNAHHF